MIEGIVTCGLALIAFFTLTDRPETARWLNEEEKREPRTRCLIFPLNLSSDSAGNGSHQV